MNPSFVFPVFLQLTHQLPVLHLVVVVGLTLLRTHLLDHWFALWGYWTWQVAVLWLLLCLWALQHLVHMLLYLFSFFSWVLKGFFEFSGLWLICSVRGGIIPVLGALLFLGFLHRTSLLIGIFLSIDHFLQNVPLLPFLVTQFLSLLLQFVKHLLFSFKVKGVWSRPER